MNVTVKSKKLLDRQFESLGIATDNSMGSANILATGGKAILGWIRDNPEDALALADAGMEVAQSQKRTANSGRSNKAPSTSNKSSVQAKRNREISVYLNEFQGMSGTMREELIAKGIITPGAQLEMIRNSFADQLYSSPMMSLLKKSTLIYLINQMDKSIASMNE